MSDLFERDVAIHVASVITAHRDADQPGATFRAVEAALGATIGHKLFTVLVHSPGLRQHRRLHSNRPAAYPVGDSMPTDAFPLWQHLLAEGEPYIGRNADDIREAFFDHELILSLGCESVLNMPVRWAGQTLGSLNLLHVAHWYSAADVPLARLFAQLTLPAMMLGARM
jgi:hypothetical protein